MLHSIQTKNSIKRLKKHKLAESYTIYTLSSSLVDVSFILVHFPLEGDLK